MSIIVALSLAALAAPPAPPPPQPSALVPVIADVGEESGGPIVAEVMLLNPLADRAREAPDRLAVTLHIAGRDFAVVLVREGPLQRIAGNGYARVRYSAMPPEGASGDAVLSLGEDHKGYAFALAAPSAPQQVAAIAATPPPTPEARPARHAAPDILANLSTYEPVYVASGAGTDSDVRVQLSFKYQLFGQKGDPDGSWLNGFHFAYTQRIFWDVAVDSQPFRDESYQPELLYIYSRPANSHGVVLGARGGFLHESNGKGGADSRGYQILYVQPQVELPVGGMTLSVGPRYFQYILSRDNNPDIGRYRGHQALALSIGSENGLKLSTYSRLNFGTGRGSVDADLSYPLSHIFRGTPLYLVVQGFTGYGEDLLDYNRRQTRLRVGLGIVR